MRLQVFLSHSGVSSRREAFKLVKEGLVKVNGKVIDEPSFDVEAVRDNITLKGESVKLPGKIYIKINKPPGFVTTRKDRHAKRIIGDLLPDRFRNLYPVGRLDKDTQGLLILTNDGELTFRITHPKFKIKKVYLATVYGHIDHNKKRC